ncbi:MAG: nitrate transporter [Mastigocoleus sp.]
MDRSILLDVLHSLQLLFVGYTPAAAFGLLIGLIIGINRFSYQICKRLLLVPHSITPIAFLPLALILIKQAEPASIFVVFIGSLWTVLIKTSEAVQKFRQNDNLRIAFREIFDALRIGIWIAWMTVIATEIITGAKGIGFLLWDAYNNRNTINLVQSIFYIGIIGFLIDQLLELTAFIVSSVLPEQKKTSIDR